MYLIYETEEQCQVDLNKIYASMIQETACYWSGKLYNHVTNEEDYILNLSESELTAEKYPLYGRNCRTKKLNKTSGFTDAWAMPQEDINGKWYFLKPKKEYCIGLTGAEVQSIESPQIDETQGD